MKKPQVRLCMFGYLLSARILLMAWKQPSSAARKGVLVAVRAVKEADFRCGMLTRPFPDEGFFAYCAEFDQLSLCKYRHDPADHAAYKPFFMDIFAVYKTIQTVSGNAVKVSQ